MIFSKALLADGTRKDILVENGKITQIAPHIEGDSRTDCQPYLMLSGMIDGHVHFRDPGFPHKETAETGTKAALRGGVTSILDMPNTLPLCVTAEALEQKKRIYAENSLCSYGFHFGADARDNIGEVQRAKGYASLKIFLNESTGHMLVTDGKLLDRFFEAAPFISVHAEGEAVDRALYLAKKHRNTLYLCHISLEEELISIKKAKSRGVRAFAEATPHHVLFDNSSETVLLTMKPRLRSARDRQKLLEALDEGLVDTWGTDHAPHLVSEKEAQPTYGIEGIEFALENLITLAQEMGWKMEKAQTLYSSKPAEIFGIRGKGRLQEGFDADFVLVDPSPYTPSSDDVVSKCGWSPYVGRPLGAKVHSTYIGGVRVHCEGAFFSSPYRSALGFVR